MLSIDWDNALKIKKKDVNTSFNNFSDKINSIIDKYMPLKKLSKNEVKMKLKPWINQEIVQSINKKNNLLKKYINCKDPTKRNILHNAFKKLKNEITAKTRQNKKEYYKTYFTSNMNNSKKIWQGINQIINVKSKQFGQPSSIFSNDKTLLTDQNAISNEFNKYFTTIADNILKKRKYHGKRSFREFLPNPLKKFFLLVTL